MEKLLMNTYYMFNIISVKNSKNRKKKVLGEENTIKTLVILGPVFPNLIECSKGPGAPGLLGIQVHLAFYLQLLSEKVHMVVTVNTHLKMQTTKWLQRLGKVAHNLLKYSQCTRGGTAHGILPCCEAERCLCVSQT